MIADHFSLLGLRPFSYFLIGFFAVICINFEYYTLMQRVYIALKFKEQRDWTVLYVRAHTRSTHYLLLHIFVHVFLICTCRGVEHTTLSYYLLSCKLVLPYSLKRKYCALYTINEIAAPSFLKSKFSIYDRMYLL